MKKDYMKPTMRVVELRHRTSLLAGSGADGLNGKTMDRHRGNDDTITDSDNDVIF